MSLVEIREAEVRQRTTAKTCTTQVIIVSLYIILISSHGDNITSNGPTKCPSLSYI